MKTSIQFLVLTFFVIFSITSCTNQSAVDYSNRISLANPTLLAGFNDNSYDGFTPSPGLNLSLSDASDFYAKPSEGTACLKVEPSDSLPASTWRSISKTFDTPLDLTSTPIGSFAIFSHEGPAIKQTVRMRLFSGKKSFEGEAQIIPTLWRTVIFSFTDCPFLSKVTAIEIGLKDDSQEPWVEGRSFLIDALSFGSPLDLGFTLPGSTQGFTSWNGEISWENDALEMSFNSDGAKLFSPDLTGSRNKIYNPRLEDRNTFFIVLKNSSSIKKVRLNWSTTEYPAGSKEFAIEPNSDYIAYYFNISDCHEAKGALKSFSIESLDGDAGTWSIDEIRFEREEPIIEYAGELTSCTADKENVLIEGKVSGKYLNDYPTLAIYEYPFRLEGTKPSELKEIYSCPTSAQFEIKDLPNSRLGGKMTHLSTRFLAVVRNAEGETIPLAQPFFITNWEDFCVNPYSFTLPDNTFDVCDYGAKGDGFTDDTEAIQKAIDACSAAGGGRVLLNGANTSIGKRYVATHLTLRSNVDFNISEGAVLWQSYDIRDYDYVPAYGHDFAIPACPWTHCLYVNYPLLQGNDIENVKITGKGKIRMADPYSENPDWTHYARTCSDRIHICPIAISTSRNIEITNLDVVRSNNYHTLFQGDEYMFFGNVKFYEVQCVSGDGFSFGQGTKHVCLERVFFDSNDDGIVLTSSYQDPRGKNSPWRLDVDEADHSVRDIKVEHSYINSATKGGGKAIAIIPWGSTNPDLSKQRIDSIQVFDCVLNGGHSVGTWCDNPFDGKPFTNEEENDYAPVSNFYLLNNEYQSLCDLLSVKPTTFVTDCGLHSSSSIINGDFKDGVSYWTTVGDAGVENGEAFAKASGAIWEGLYLEKGKYAFVAKVRGSGQVFCREIISNSTLESISFAGENDWKTVTMNVTINAPGDYSFGISSSDSAQISTCEINKK